MMGCVMQSSLKDYFMEISGFRQDDLTEESSKTHYAQQGKKYMLK